MTYHQFCKAECEDCGSASNLHVHHCDENPRNNEPSNLRTLCGRCHALTHWRIRRGDSSEIEHIRLRPVAHPLVVKARADLGSLGHAWDDIAKRSKMSRSWISKFARGEINNPTINSLQSIMDAVDIITRESPKRRRAAA